MSNPSLVNSVVKIDGNFYGVLKGTYTRRWTRSFSSNLAANIVRLNFVDRGPGIRVYSFQVMAYNWASTSLPFAQGVTQNYDAQKTGIEVSYSKIATPFNFIDPFGEPPTFSGVLQSPATAGSTTLQIDSNFASLISTPPTAAGTYPYPLYIWANGNSLGLGLEGAQTLDTVQVTAVSGTTITCTATSYNWSAGANLAVPVGVYFTNLNQIETPDMTSSSPRVIYEVELTEATQVVA